MTQTVDVIVAGLGAMGSATACHLAERGRSVIGFDRWAPGHTFGSSHGDSRIIREIYFEHPMYVPLVRRAYALWRELEGRTNRKLFRQTGGLMMGAPDGEIVGGTLRAAREWNMPHDVLTPAEVARRFPAFTLAPEAIAVFDPRAGYLAPEDCTWAHLQIAQSSGAALRFDEAVVSWAPDGDGVSVVTTAGAYRANHLVLAAGARTQALLPDLALPLTIERQVLHWFDMPASAIRYEPARCPIWAYEFERGRFCYGFPRLPRGVKAAVMHGGDQVADANAVRREVDSSDADSLRPALAGVLPDLAVAPIRESEVCLFTNMPDGNFLIDVHPAHRQVLILSPCSGHGFKFASAIGEIAADLVTTGKTTFDLSAFALR